MTLSTYRCVFQELPDHWVFENATILVHLIQLKATCCTNWIKGTKAVPGPEVVCWAGRAARESLV